MINGILKESIFKMLAKSLSLIGKYEVLSGYLVSFCMVCTFQYVEVVKNLWQCLCCCFPIVGLTLLFLYQVKNEAAVLGFVGAPFTLASYCVEGGSSKNFTMIKKLAFSEPAVLRRSLFHMNYIIFSSMSSENCSCM